MYLLGKHPKQGLQTTPFPLSAVFLPDLILHCIYDNHTTLAIININVFLISVYALWMCSSA